MGEANKQTICRVLMELAENDPCITVVCSDSRGSGSMAEFANRFPDQFIEVGIAEQSLVSVSAGLAAAGMKPVAVSPASFLSTRSMEQVKVDCAYSHNNVKLLGISGGISYGALGMTHHSTTDIADMASIPGMRVYLPSDRIQTECLMRSLMGDSEPAYIRTGRNAVDDVYDENCCSFEMDRASVVREGTDLAIIACGEMVLAAKRAAEALGRSGISAAVFDMYCVKPIDREAVIKAARTGLVITAEENVAIGGMWSMVSQIIARECPCRVINLTLPDEPVITGTSKEIFSYYGLDADGIVSAAAEALKEQQL